MFRGTWSKVLALTLVLTFSGLMSASVGLADPYNDPPPAQGSPAGAGLQAASWLATVPYGAAKVGFALVGGVVGGLTYVLTGGNEKAAKSVWKTSMYGTYVLTPEHLRGEKPIRFLGSEDRSETHTAQVDRS